VLARIKRLFFEGEVLRLMGLTALVKPIGLVTQSLLATYFGASARYDAYVLAVFLVSFVEMTLGRVFTAAVVPFAIRVREGAGARASHGLLNATYVLFILPGIAYTLVLMLRGEWLLDLAARNAPPETRAHALQMLRWMALPGLAMLVVEMGKSTHNMRRSFSIPATMPLVNGLVFLAVVVFAHDVWGVKALPLAFAAGTAAQFLAVWGGALMKRLVGFVRPGIEPGMRSTLWALSWMIMVSTTFQTVNAFLDKMFASGLETGSISSIAYAGTLMNFGIQVFTLSLVTVMFTRMSEYLAASDLPGCSRYVEDNLLRLSRLVVLGAVVISIVSPELVRVLFQRGAFTEADAARTSSTLAVYMLGLPALIINAVITRIFHSLQKMRDKMWLSLQYLLTNALGNVLLIGSMKVVGLAVSSTLAINIHLGLSLLVLHRYRTPLAIGRFSSLILRAYLMGAAAWAIYALTGTAGLLEGLLPGQGVGETILLGCAKAGAYTLIFGGLMVARALRRR
jgi:putative peptidoglycan lipid II flippase